MIVVRRPDGVLLWTHVTETVVCETRGGNLSIFIPAASVLNRSALPPIATLCGWDASTEPSVSRETRRHIGTGKISPQP